MSSKTGESVVKGRQERERILLENEESIRSIPMPDLIQDNCKSRLLVCLFFAGFYMNFVELLNIIRKYDSSKELETADANEAKSKTLLLQNLKFIFIYILSKTIFYFVMLFILGCINSSRKPQYILTIISFLLVPSFLYATITISSVSVSKVIESGCWVSIPLLLLYNMIIGCSKNASKSYFVCIKNQVYYEYTFQRMFGRPSFHWAGRYFQKAWEADRKKSVNSRVLCIVLNSILGIPG